MHIGFLIGLDYDPALARELDQELGQLSAEMLLDLIGKEIGGAFYNRGVHDAQQLVQQTAEDTVEALYGLERG
ncbi:MAG: DUF2164 domain-containing protein [Brevundimonas sp.]